LTGGLVVSNYGAELNGITIFESSHPMLTEKSIRAAEILMRGMMLSYPEKDPVPPATIGAEYILPDIR
jgi:glycerate-2-kinase